MWMEVNIGGLFLIEFRVLKLLWNLLLRFSLLIHSKLILEIHKFINFKSVKLSGIDENVALWASPEHSKSD